MPIMPDANIIAFQDTTPKIDDTAFIASGARIIGDTVIGKDSSIWFNVVVRGDVNYIRIGERTNIQDNSTVHVTTETGPCIIGDEVTIGHNAIIHACKIENNCLIGMGATVMDDAIIREGSIVGAGAVVTMGKEFPPNSLILGAPAKAVKTIGAKEHEAIKYSVNHYLDTVKGYK